MKLRLGLALLLVIGPMAFAPAPLPRRTRGGEGDVVTLSSFQGNWRLVKRVDVRADGKHVPTQSPVTHIRITQDRWAFMAGNSQVNAFFISVDSSKKPAQLNFYDAQGPNRRVTGVGLLRRMPGGGIQVLYGWGGEQGRPVDFDPPKSGYWLADLQRD